MEKSKSSLLVFAEQELARITGDGDMQERINEGVLDMVKVFCGEAYSGVTAIYVVNILNRLLRFLPLTPIEDVPEDWFEFSPGVYQHLRCPRVFKDSGKFDGKAYILDAKVFSADGGETWFTGDNSKERIEFPYTVPTSSKYYLVDGEGNILSEYVA
jgi:hypothetical protein